MGSKLTELAAREEYFNTGREFLRKSLFKLVPLERQLVAFEMIAEAMRIEAKAIMVLQ